MFRIGVIPPALAVVCLLAPVNSANGQPTPAAPIWRVGKIVVQVDNARLFNSLLPLTPPTPMTERIIFDPTDDIVVSDLTGSWQRKVAEGVDPEFSPDGHFIAYCGYTNMAHDDMQIMAIKPDGSGKIQLTNIKGAPRDPAWSPDGTKIAFNATSNKGPVVMVLDLVNAKILAIAPGAFPRWSPNGKRLVFVQSPGADSGPYSISIANPDGTGVERIVDIRAPVPSATWGADGASIIYTSDERHRSAIFRVKLDGTDPEEIAGDKNLEMYSPSISPDGKQLVVVEGELGSQTLMLIDLGTGKSRTLKSASRASILWVKNH
jgi:Tol biopolymer transport system component